MLKKILFGVRKGGRKGGREGWGRLEYPHGIYIPIQRIPSYIPSPFKGYLPIWYLFVLNSPVKIGNQILILGINFEGRYLGVDRYIPLMG